MLYSITMSNEIYNQAVSPTSFPLLHFIPRDYLEPHKNPCYCQFILYSWFAREALVSKVMDTMGSYEKSGFLISTKALNLNVPHFANDSFNALIEIVNFHAISRHIKVSRIICRHTCTRKHTDYCIEIYFWNIIFP